MCCLVCAHRYLCWWEEWAGPDNCTFDGAAEVFKWVYGPESLAGGRNNNTAVSRAIQPHLLFVFQHDLRLQNYQKATTKLPQNYPSTSSFVHSFMHASVRACNQHQTTHDSCSMKTPAPCKELDRSILFQMAQHHSIIHAFICCTFADIVISVEHKQFACVCVCVCVCVCCGNTTQTQTRTQARQSKAMWITNIYPRKGRNLEKGTSYKHTWA